MKPITRVYLKTFLVSGLTFGTLMSCSAWIDGDEPSLGKFLFHFFFFGLFSTLPYVRSHIQTLRKNGVEDITIDHFRVIQTRHVRTGLNVQELFEKIHSVPIFAEMKVSEIENGFCLKTGWSWKSFGEEIKITLVSDNGDEYEYQITSSPLWKLTLFDYGRNFENVNRIENAIKNVE